MRGADDRRAVAIVAADLMAVSQRVQRDLIAEGRVDEEHVLRGAEVVHVLRAADVAEDHGHRMLARTLRRFGYRLRTGRL